MNAIPHELTWGEIYFPPSLLVVALAYGFTNLVTKAVVKTGLYRCVAFPVIAEISLMIIFIGAISRFIPMF
ncbi:DUF1656 domain-containing protein [Vibrio algicola]|uniref:DUF1656 domain-containing protein n=1 Tax=Vibrio algicola TaxID=2662262 RepID=A0A5Q0TME0_9VIBR|nr:DUF1656 domain-containing protein [Vibrio algicola]